MTRSFKLTGPRRPGGSSPGGDLNEQQRAVVTAAGGPMLVIAGAGTGKTRTLTHRLAWLLQNGVDPSRVLLMTFTNRAAREMLHRVAELLPCEAHRVVGGTFHHVANRVLRTDGAALGLSPEFTILDREDAADLLGACRVESGVKIERRRFPAPAVLASIASLAASTLVPTERVLLEKYPMFVDLLEPIERVLALYVAEKRRRQFLDYDDLLLEWRRLLEEHPDVRAAAAERYLHILVDEYQDTNAIQGRIVDLLGAAHRNVCVVGDDSQSIYGFRGARFENIMGFRARYPDVTEYRLEVNYRSTPQILALANRSIACNRRRLPKELRAARAPGLRPAMVPCADHFVQSHFIAAYILQLLDEGRQLTDIAVLYRSHWHGMEIQLELQRRDIPFSVRGGLRFFEQAHVKDVLSVLRLRHNGHDDLAWQRVLRLLPRFGAGLARRVWEHIEMADDPLARACEPATGALLPPVARGVFTGFTTLLERLGGLAAPAPMIGLLLEEFYAEHLASRYADATLRRRDLEAVADFAASYHTVEAFLSDVALTGDFNAETCEDGPPEQLFVTLSTVHQAKGLEWPVVLIPWASDGRFPTDMAMGSDDDLEEERRVFHVAVTRARDELYLVVPQIWSNHRRERILMKPSRFLSEVEGNDLLETMRLEHDLPEVTAGPGPGATAAAGTGGA